MSVCSRNTSSICQPTVFCGFSAVIGSWKIIAMRSPRSPRICASVSVDRSCPSNFTDPPDMRTSGSGSRRTTAPAARLLPDPLSPTRQTISPGFTVRFSPSSA